MLNGKYPILIFHLYAYDKIANSILGLINQPAQTFATSAIGVPIPFILSQELTGIALDDETKSMEIDTTIDAPLDSSVPPIAKQMPVVSNINVSLSCNRDSVFLTILSALGDLLFRRCTAGDYGITYMNGPIVIFDGLLSRFSTMRGANSTLMRVDFSLSLGKQETKQPDKPPSKQPLPNVVGTAAGPGTL